MFAFNRYLSGFWKYFLLSRPSSRFAKDKLNIFILLQEEIFFMFTCSILKLKLCACQGLKLKSLKLRLLFQLWPVLKSKRVATFKVYYKKQQIKHKNRSHVLCISSSVNNEHQMKVCRRLISRFMLKAVWQHTKTAPHSFGRCNLSACDLDDCTVLLHFTQSTPQ